MGLTAGFSGVLLNILCGNLVNLRENNLWLIYFLPLGGVFTVFLYEKCKIKNSRDIDEVFEAANEGKSLNPIVAATLFVSASVTQFLGGSSGKRGSASQIGGILGSYFSDIFKLDKAQRKVMILSGVSAAFSGLTSTPLTACFFAAEFRAMGILHLPAVLPCAAAAFTASKLADIFGIKRERYFVNFNQNFNFTDLLKIIFLVFCVVILGIFVSKGFKNARKIGEKYFKNPYIRTLFFTLIIIILTAFLGNQSFSSGSTPLTAAAFSGETQPFTFLFKFIFTFLTMASGLKGGRLAPIFCIGSTFGCLFASIFALDAGICAAISLIILFAISTNRIFTAVFLALEMFLI